MPWRAIVLLLLLFGLVQTGTVSRAQDQVVGAIWEVWVKNPKTGKYDRFGLMRCTTDGKVFKDGKIIGSHKNTDQDVEITIDNAPNAFNNGTSKATRVTKNGTAWEGVHTRKDGTEVPIRFRLIKD